MRRKKIVAIIAIFAMIAIITIIATATTANATTTTAVNNTEYQVIVISPDTITVELPAPTVIVSNGTIEIVPFETIVLHPEVQIELREVVEVVTEAPAPAAAPAAKKGFPFFEWLFLTLVIASVGIITVWLARK